MKKTYNLPKVKIVNVEIMPLLINSANLGGNKGTYDSEKQTQLSREGRDSSWDDEE